MVFDSSVTGHEFTFGGLSGSIYLALQDDASSPNAVGLTVGGDNADTIFSGVLSGGGALTKVGTGALELTGANSYGGSTALNGGMLTFAAGGLGNTASVVFNGGALQWSVSNDDDVSPLISPIGSGQAAILDTNGNDVTFANALSGTGGLTKTGIGTLTLTAANTYTGTTTIDGGTLSFDSSAALGQHRRYCV